MAISVLKERIIEKLQDLPDADLLQVLDFLDFVTGRTAQDDDPLLSMAGSLSGKALSAEEIENELYTAVSPRAIRRGGALHGRYLCCHRKATGTNRASEF
jgi:hypothetical protein